MKNINSYILGLGFSFFGMRSKSKENVLDNNDSNGDVNDIKKLSTVDKPIDQSRKFKNSENLADFSTKSAQSRRKSSLEKLKKMKNEMFGKRHSALKDDDEAAKDDEDRVHSNNEKNSEEEDLDFELQKGGDTSESGLGTSMGDTTKTFSRPPSSSLTTATYTVESSVTKESTATLYNKSGTEDNIIGLDNLKRSEPLYSKPIDRKSSASPTSPYRTTSPNKLAFLNDSTNQPASTSTPLRGMSASGTPTRAMSPVNGRTR